MLVPWPEGSFPKYVCKNCKVEVLEINGRFRYLDDQFHGPSEDCDLELIKSVVGM